jgi:hypothetical protein
MSSSDKRREYTPPFAIIGQQASAHTATPALVLFDRKVLLLSFGSIIFVVYFLLKV